MSQSNKTKKYFDSWAEDYEAAFMKKNTGKSLLHRLINIFFRKKTFYLRNKFLSKKIDEIGVRNKKILDVGCGTGQLAIYSAYSGGDVTGLDISKEMIKICNDKIKNIDFNGKVQFQAYDCFNKALPKSDIVLCVAFIEYYKDIDIFLEKLCNSAKQTLILVDARHVWWRAYSRKFLGFIKNFSVFYHDPTMIKNIVKQNGMKCTEENDLYSFKTFIFHREF